MAGSQILVLNGTSSAGKTSIGVEIQQIRPPEGSQSGIAIKAGPLGHRVIAAMHRAIAVMASAGLNLIVDHVLLEPEWREDLAQVLSGHPVLFVGVRCPLSVVEQRERERGDRVFGQARGHFETVHAHAVYDIEVDTSLLSPRECALRIADHLQTGRPSDAFDRMRTRRD